MHNQTVCETLTVIGCRQPCHVLVLRNAGRDVIWMLCACAIYLDIDLKNDEQAWLTVLQIRYWMSLLFCETQ